MIEPNTETLLSYGGGATALLLALNYFIRLFSRNRVEGSKDKAEINIIDRLQEENRLLREQARLAYAALHSSQEEVNRLRTEMALLKRDLSDALDKLAVVKTKIEELDRRGK